MHHRGVWQKRGLILLLAAVTTLSGAHVVLAETSTSPSYQVTEMQLGTGINQEGCSDTYCAYATIGDMVAGSSSSASFTTEFFGPNAPEDPLVEVIIHPGESDLGILSEQETARKTAVIHIRTHQTSGYILQLVGDAPRSDNHTLYALATPTPSRPGTEQFGINLVKNTDPEVGENPVQYPDEEEVYGWALEDYASPDLFKYIDRDIVARSTAESGQTSYTVSMIMNISSSTPAGHYDGNYSVIVTPLF